MRYPNDRQTVTLPPGQRAVDGFPRFGTHLHHRPPPVSVNPVIKICGAVARPIALPLTELSALPRRNLVADFHCVAGWSATDLCWEGVPFEAFYRAFIEPLPPEQSVTHIAFGGLDRYRSIVTIEDAFAADVLIAEKLDGRPLDPDHGAPVRIVSPPVRLRQYQTPLLDRAPHQRTSGELPPRFRQKPGGVATAGTSSASEGVEGGTSSLPPRVVSAAHISAADSTLRVSQRAWQRSRDSRRRTPTGVTSVRPASWLRAHRTKRSKSVAVESWPGLARGRPR
jgi:hypothetical protein